MSFSDKIAWRTLKVRDTHRGELWIRFSTLKVWRIEDEIPPAPKQFGCLSVKSWMDPIPNSPFPMQKILLPLKLWQGGRADVILQNVLYKMPKGWHGLMNIRLQVGGLFFGGGGILY